MSWDAHVTNMTGQGLQYAGLFDLKGNIWAKSPEWEITPAEVAEIIRGIRAGGFPEGLFVGGKKFMMIDCRDECVIAKHKNAQNESETVLICCKISKQCIILGIKAGAGERDARRIVEGYADYLGGIGY